MGVWGRQVFPDPHGVVGFALVSATFLAHLAIVSTGRPYLVSENIVLEALAHVALLLAPPLGAYLGVRHLLCRGDSLLPLLTVPMGLFLTVVTLVAVGVALGA